MNAHLLLAFMWLVFLCATSYLAWQLIDKKASKPIKITAGLLIALITTSVPLYFFVVRRRYEVPDWIFDCITYGMGFFSLLITFTVLRHVARLIFKISPWRKNTSPERRAFLHNSSRIGVIGLTAAVFGKAAHNALAMPTIQRVNIAIKDLPTELEGFSIAQISDVHIGQLKNEAQYVAQIVHAVNACNADIVAVTGDIVDGSVTRLAHAVAPLAQLKSKFGTFFVTGNHEYYSKAIDWIAHFKTLGWQVLQNEHRNIQIKGHTVTIAGVNDLHAKRYIAQHNCNPQAALTNAPNDAALRLLLAHHPGTAKLTDGLNIDLQISGHTHAGQYFPATWIVQWVHPYSQGLNLHNDMQVYVNSGTGYWGPALRTSDIVGEVTLIKLYRA